MDILLQALEDYGYWVLFIGTFLEGETILLVAGYAASLGWMELPLCIAAAFSGTFFGDQLYFFIGRKWGRQVFHKRTKATRRRITLVLHLLHKYDIWFILAFRFIYGVRNVTPFAVGISRVPTYRFFILNMLAALVWAVTFANLGFWFGKGLEKLMSDAHNVQLWALAILVAGILTVWGVRRWKSGRAASST